MAWQNFPMIECPHCNQGFQVEEYYLLKAGDKFYCGKCEEEIYIWAIDTTMSGDIQAKPEGK